MVDIFCGNPRYFGNFYKEFCFHSYDTFYHRDSGYSLRMYTGRIDMYSRAILERLKQALILEELRYEIEIIRLNFWKWY